MNNRRASNLLSSSVLTAIFVVSCGTQPNTADIATANQTLHNDKSLSRTFALKCTAESQAEKKLAFELSKKCREDNAILKAKGVPSCGDDYCTEGVALETELKGIEAEVTYDGSEVEFLVTLSTNFSLPQKDKQALICYSPLIKARELLASSSLPCH